MGFNQAGTDVERKGRIAGAEKLLLSLVVSLVRQQPASTIPLQTYLENLRWLAWRWSDRHALAFEELIELLCLGFVPAAMGSESNGNAVDTFLAWDQCVTDRLDELSQRQSSQTLAPCDYLEAAIDEAFKESPDHHARALRTITWAEFADFLQIRGGPRHYSKASAVSISSDSR